MKKAIILCVLVFLGFAAAANAKGDAAENVVVRSIVLDGDTKEPLIGAVVTVGDGDKGAITNESGEFTLSLPAGRQVVLNLSYMGYEEMNAPVAVPAKGGKIGPLLMVRSSMKMKDVTVRGQAPIGLVKGDTTQYNASAFKANPDASSSDLLAKMPGMEVSDDGSVTSQGESIEVIYVDGKSYFKNDVATALASLPANIVESVQVFDERSAQGKFLNYDDGNNKKAINIVTKPQQVRKTNFVGEVMAGYGTGNHYMTSANMNMMGEKDRLVVGFAANNLNISPNRQFRFYGHGGMSGVNSALGGRINYIRTLKDGEFAFSYILDNDNRDIRSTVTKDYLSLDQQGTQQDSSMNRSFSHRIGIDYEQTLNPRNRIEAEFNARITTQNDFNKKWQENIIDGSQSNAALTNTSVKGESYSFNGEVTYIHKFNDKRDIAVEVDGSYSDSESTQVQTGYTIDAQAAADNESIDQETRKDVQGNSVTGEIRYTEAIGKNSRLVFSYRGNYDWGASKRYVYDLVSGDYVDLNSLSSDYNRDYFTNRGGIAYIFNRDAHRVNVWANYEYATRHSEAIFPAESTLKRSYNGLNLRASYRYKKNNQEFFDIFLRTAPSYPSVENLQEVLDVSDPLHVSSGNSQLTPSQTTRLRFMYSKSNIDKSTVFRVMANVSNTQNSISRNTWVLKEDAVIQGVALAKNTEYTQLVNLDGSWMVFGGGWYSFPLTKIKTNMEVGFMYHYNRTPSMFDGEKFITNSHSPSLMLRFTSNITENVDFNIFNRTSYTHSLATNGKINRSLVEDVGAQLNFIFGLGFFLNVDYTFRYNYYIDQPIDDPFRNQLNAAVGKKFFNDSFEVRASAFDILGQNRSISQSVNEIVVNNTISNNLERYFALSVRWKFNTLKKNGMQAPDGGAPSHRGPQRFSM